MTIPVVWINYNPDRPAGPDPYWDNAIVKWLLGEAWVPGMPVFEHHWSFDDVAPSEGVVVVTPGHYGPDGITELNRAIGGHPWALVIITSDEEGAFPAWLIEHPRLKVWKQHPKRDLEWQPDVALPLGWRPGTREHFAGTATPVKRLDWFYAGQGGAHRQTMLDYLARLPGGALKITGGFAQGVDQTRYLEGMASAAIAPCPPGPATPDTFRLWEGLEAGCVPYVAYDDAEFFGESYGLPIRRDGLSEIADGSVWRAGDIGATYLGLKRTLTYVLRTDLEWLSRDDRYWSTEEKITVLVSTSPIASHPDTHILDETIASIRARLPRSEILVMCDGVRPEQEALTDRYNEYLRRLVWKCMHHWDNTYPIIMSQFVDREESSRYPATVGEFVHQAEATRRTLQLVHTPLILFVEHDTPLIGDIPFGQLGDAVMLEDLIIRLHHEAAVHPEHVHLNAGPLRTVAGVPVQPTVQWSQRPHLARTMKYEGLINTYFTPASRTFIEDKMHGVAHHDRWEDWRLALYHPEGDIKRSTHTDGRAGASKFDVVF